MTDRNDIIRQIEERIGDEATRELAELMFDELESRGGIEFDDEDGYDFVRDDEDPAWGGGQIVGWDKALAAAVAESEEETSPKAEEGKK